MRRKLIALVAVIILIVISIVLWRWEGHRHAPAAKPAAIPVKLVTAQEKSLPVIASAIGSIVAPQDVTLKAQVAGQVGKLAFKNGQQV